MSGSTLTIQGAGNVTITARQAGNYAYRAATPEIRTFFVKLVGRPLLVLFDGGGTMGANESFKAPVSLKDGTTGKLIDPTKYTTIGFLLYYQLGHRYHQCQHLIWYGQYRNRFRLI